MTQIELPLPAGLTQKSRILKLTQRLTDLARLQWLKKLGRSLPPPPLTLRQKAEIRECFNLMDSDGDGNIDMRELFEAFAEIGLTIDHDTVRKVLHQVDPDQSGGLDIEEFMSIMSHALRMEAGEHVYGESIEKQAATQTVGKESLGFADAVRAFRRKRLIDALMKGGESRAKVVLVHQRTEDSVREEMAAIRAKLQQAEALAREKSARSSRSHLSTRSTFRASKAKNALRSMVTSAAASELSLQMSNSRTSVGSSLQHEDSELDGPRSSLGTAPPSPHPDAACAAGAEDSNGTSDGLPRAPSRTRMASALGLLQEVVLGDSPGARSPSFGAATPKSALRTPSPASDPAGVRLPTTPQGGGGSGRVGFSPEPPSPGAQVLGTRSPSPTHHSSHTFGPSGRLSPFSAGMPLLNEPVPEEDPQDEEVAALEAARRSVEMAAMAEAGVPTRLNLWGQEEVFWAGISPLQAHEARLLISQEERQAQQDQEHHQARLASARAALGLAERRSTWGKAGRVRERVETAARLYFESLGTQVDKQAAKSAAKERLSYLMTPPPPATPDPWFSATQPPRVKVGCDPPIALMMARSRPATSYDSGTAHGLRSSNPSRGGQRPETCVGGVRRARTAGGPASTSAPQAPGSVVPAMTVGRTGQTNNSGEGGAEVGVKAGAGVSAAVPFGRYPRTSTAVEDRPLSSFHTPTQQQARSGAAATQNSDGNVTFRAALVSASGSAVAGTSVPGPPVATFMGLAPASVPSTTASALQGITQEARTVSLNSGASSMVADAVTMRAASSVIRGGQPQLMARVSSTTLPAGGTGTTATPRLYTSPSLPPGLQAVPSGSGAPSAGFALNSASSALLHAASAPASAFAAAMQPVVAPSSNVQLLKEPSIATAAAKGLMSGTLVVGNRDVALDNASGPLQHASIQVPPAGALGIPDGTAGEAWRAVSPPQGTKGALMMHIPRLTNGQGIGPGLPSAQVRTPGDGVAAGHHHRSVQPPSQAPPTQQQGRYSALGYAVPPSTTQATQPAGVPVVPKPSPPGAASSASATAAAAAAAIDAAPIPTAGFRGSVTTPGAATGVNINTVGASTSETTAAQPDGKRRPAPAPLDMQSIYDPEQQPPLQNPRLHSGQPSPTHWATSLQAHKHVSPPRKSPAASPSTPSSPTRTVSGAAGAAATALYVPWDQVAAAYLDAGPPEEEDPAVSDSQGQEPSGFRGDVSSLTSAAAATATSRSGSPTGSHHRGRGVASRGSSPPRAHPHSSSSSPLSSPTHARAGTPPQLGLQASASQLHPAHPHLQPTLRVLGPSAPSAAFADAMSSGSTVHASTAPHLGTTAPAFVPEHVLQPQRHYLDVSDKQVLGIPSPRLTQPSAPRLTSPAHPRTPPTHHPGPPALLQRSQGSSANPAASDEFVYSPPGVGASHTAQIKPFGRWSHPAPAAPPATAPFTRPGAFLQPRVGAPRTPSPYLPSQKVLVTSSQLRYPLTPALAAGEARPQTAPIAMGSPRNAAAQLAAVAAVPHTGDHSDGTAEEGGAVGGEASITAQPSAPAPSTGTGRFARVLETIEAFSHTPPQLSVGGSSRQRPRTQGAADRAQTRQPGGSSLTPERAPLTGPGLPFSHKATHMHTRVRSSGDALVTSVYAVPPSLQYSPWAADMAAALAVGGMSSRPAETWARASAPVVLSHAAPAAVAETGTGREGNAVQDVNGQAGSSTPSAAAMEPPQAGPPPLITPHVVPGRVHTKNVLLSLSHPLPATATAALGLGPVPPPTPPVLPPAALQAQASAGSTQLHVSYLTGPPVPPGTAPSSRPVTRGTGGGASRPGSRPAGSQAGGAGQRATTPAGGLAQRKTMIAGPAAGLGPWHMPPDPQAQAKAAAYAGFGGQRHATGSAKQTKQQKMVQQGRTGAEQQGAVGAEVMSAQATSHTPPEEPGAVQHTGGNHEATDALSVEAAATQAQPSDQDNGTPEVSVAGSPHSTLSHSAGITPEVTGPSPASEGRHSPSRAQSLPRVTSSPRLATRLSESAGLLRQGSLPAGLVREGLRAGQVVLPGGGGVAGGGAREGAPSPPPRAWTPPPVTPGQEPPPFASGLEPDQ